jgi:TrmH family RNA methyltransferase
MQESLNIVLLEPEQPRNIGAVVRVAANFGLHAVKVVRPKDFTAEEDREIRVASSGAASLVTLRVSSLDEALEGSQIVLGTSGRRRSAGIPTVSAVAEFPGASENQDVAVMFGRESKGLTTAELNLCHGLIRLPVSEDFPSLNLAQAVGIIVYGWKLANQDKMIQHPTPAVRASKVLQERWLAQIGVPSKAEAQLRRLLARAAPSDEDMALLFNLLKSVNRKK